MNYIAILIAAVAQFIIGAIWYMPVFGKLWGKIHGFDEVPKDMQKHMQKEMLPMLGVQFLVTLVTTVVIAVLLPHIPGTWNAYTFVGFVWLGFTLPAQVSAVVFGGTKAKWIIPKILILAGGSILCVEAAAFILQWMA